MSITVEAVYENGVLKPLQPLPFTEHDKLSITVHKETSWVDETHGLLAWTGDAESLDRLLEEAEDDFLEGK
jgi:predicted DNA-binding antitoxin AbrB/MazE fold protein